ncbi:hypothetical protein CWS72_23250 [Telmatospirillum siberiense]|uniref:DUF1501 domain-containing protein n=2 Tax=Telmatospirillum siberiense TaxID=382514 RepID=A0A2N3PP38_9PROT|nr:hypothetical protein CWS72_23250 [Telmatospirillum siberiense]
MHRRRFLRFAATAAGLAATGFAGCRPALAAAPPGKRRLVVVMLRGAVDGLNLVVPYTDPRYREMRPTIGLASPGADGGALDLDGRFGLHPALAPLLPLWRERRLAFVHACGSIDPSRSHFEAQDFMESGTPGVRGTPDGWMNRLAAAMPEPHEAIQALSLGAVRPRILAGAAPNANFALGPDAGRPQPLDRPAMAEAFDGLYSGNDPLSAAYRDGRQARRQLMADLAAEQAEADKGAPAPGGFPGTATRLARLLARDERISLAFADLGGWDTHVNQGGATGQLASRLAPLGEGLAALARGLGAALDDTVVLVMSEFGRTVHENGDKGTDHGHGNVMWVLGGRVAGGRIQGDWPGLGPADLYQGRDLAVTTDFRSVIGMVLERHMGLSDRQMAAVLPGWVPSTRLGLFTA